MTLSMDILIEEKSQVHKEELNADVEEKREGSGRKSSGTKALSTGEFMIACGAENPTDISDPKNIVDKPYH
ncbi:hypothetical protein BDC45DRAFT_572170 [Circinella umbellata]|nr:hypothetical protein BDC45DRAFT_572170 [Circinella umbellata]